MTPPADHHDTQTPAADAEAIAALRRGDEAAFAALIDRYGPSMLRIARAYVATNAVAEEVVQDAWLGVLNGIDRFEGRSSLKTWIFRILTNIAKTRGLRESRVTPFSDAFPPNEDSNDVAVDPSRFRPTEPFTDHWLVKPRSWGESAEDALVSSETQALIRSAIESLAPAQREVIQLRDIEGWSATEVCNALDLSETNQRVLLHRARSKVRKTLEQYFEGKPALT
jgi:RNA polymerase sigma-70 factor (ECF subfamily)